MILILFLIYKGKSSQVERAEEEAREEEARRGKWGRGKRGRGRGKKRLFPEN